MLELTNVEVYYGGIHALQGISIEVPDGKIVSLIGANGAGKSTTLNSIVGLVKPQAGSIAWNGKEMTALGTKRIVSEGVVLVPEGRRIFPNLTTWENITLGAYHRSDKAGIERDRDMVYELFPRLKERSKQNAGTLSGGEQQMLAVARGLMSRPKLFMLDEPSLGLAPLIMKDIFDTPPSTWPIRCTLWNRGGSRFRVREKSCSPIRVSKKRIWAAQNKAYRSKNQIRFKA